MSPYIMPPITKHNYQFQFIKNQFKRLFLLVLLVFFFVQSKGQGFLRAEGKLIVNEKGENVLLRGMGLGGWMLQEGYMLRINRDGQQFKIRARIDSLIGAKHTQEFYDAWLANHTRKIDVDSMKSWGFNSIRLPMHFNLYTLPVDKEPVKGKNTWLEKGFALTDSLLGWCKANHMYLILDLHAAPGGQGSDLNISDRDASKPSLWESEANQQKMIALWKKIAERYANEPWIGAYDIINEPNWGFSDLEKDKNGTKEQNNEPLKKLMIATTQAIREVDKNHMVIIEGNGWGNNYNGVLPPWDNNMVLSFHKYWNNNDQAAIQHILNFRDQYNIPVWLGETGENSNVWFSDAIRLLEKNNIGWAWWPLKKMGSNNPLEIHSNPNYDEILRYWNGKGKKPKESNAYSGLMELVAYTKLETNIVHKDVIDAMFRQPHSAEAKPFKAFTISNNVFLKAVDYDLGKNGIAYFDKDTADYKVSGVNGIGNRGHIYRNDGVDIRKDSTHYESYYVSDIEDGEWLQYTLNVPQAGNYTIKLTVASINALSKISIMLNNLAFTNQVSLANTGGLKNWQTFDVENIRLKSGLNTMKIYANKGGFNFQQIHFVKN